MDNETKNLIKEYFSQNNYGTAYPIYFTIRDIKWISSYHEEGDRVIAVSDGSVIAVGNTIKELYHEIKQFAHDNEYEFNDADYDELGFSKYDIIKQDFVEDMYWQVKDFENKGMFLLESEAKEHLRLNKHHYSNDARVYCEHIWRSPQTEKIINFLKEMIDI